MMIYIVVAITVAKGACGITTNNRQPPILTHRISLRVIQKQKEPGLSRQPFGQSEQENRETVGQNRKVWESYGIILGPLGNTGATVEKRLCEPMAPRHRAPAPQWCPKAAPRLSVARSWCLSPPPVAMGHHSWQQRAPSEQQLLLPKQLTKQHDEWPTSVSCKPGDLLTTKGS